MSAVLPDPAQLRKEYIDILCSCIMAHFGATQAGPQDKADVNGMLYAARWLMDGVNARYPPQ